MHKTITMSYLELRRLLVHFKNIMNETYHTYCGEEYQLKNISLDYTSRGPVGHRYYPMEKIVSFVAKIYWFVDWQRNQIIYLDERISQCKNFKHEITRLSSELQVTQQALYLAQQELADLRSLCSDEQTYPHEGAKRGRTEY